MEELVLFTTLLQKSKPALMRGLSSVYPTSPASTPAGRLITYYDHEGRKRMVSREDWRSRVLPRQLSAFSDNPKQLRRVVACAIEHGCAPEVLRATERLLVTEPEQLDNHLLRCHVLSECNRVDAAMKVLLDAEARHGRSAGALVELARIHRRKNDIYKSQEALWAALQLEPNHAQALQQWAGDQKSVDGRRDALGRAADMLGSWRARALLGRLRLEEGDIAGACEEYGAVLTATTHAREAVEMASADLVAEARYAELVELMAPIYRASAHGPWAGLHLLEALTAVGDVVRGKQLLHTLFMQYRHELRDHLQGYANKFLSMAIEREKAQASSSSGPGGMVSLVSLDMPTWWHGLRSPHWLIGPRDLEGLSIAFLLPACVGAADSALQELAAGIPLYLGETLLLRSAMSARVVVPVAPGEGTPQISAPWSDEQVFALAECDGATVDYVVSGTIEVQPSGQARVTLSLHEVESRERIAEFSRVGQRAAIAAMVRELEDELFARLSVPADGDHAIYVQPPSAVLHDYLIAHGMMLNLTLRQRGMVDRDAAGDEHALLDHVRGLVETMPEATIPKLMLISALAVDDTVGSDAHRDYQSAVAEVLRGERDPASPIYRVSPLALWVMGQDEHFAARKAQLLANAEPAYAEWLEVVGKEEDSFVVVQE
jgi:hypothetical protein